MLRRFSVDRASKILVQGVYKTFRQGDEELHVLKDVHFQACQGELVMIVGPSGSGKTTLLSAIAGTLGIDSGTITLFDFELSSKSQKEVIDFRKKNVGFIFQQFHLIPTLSCGENVAIPLLLNGFSHERALEEAYKSLAEVGLESKFNSSPRDLSGGQQQRVAIARALIHKPSLIICDEPTAALDSESGIKIMELIREHVKIPGRIVIIVTHDNRIFKYADRIEKMNDGQITNLNFGLIL
jgi:putative ABC transport system ATP-binding protein